MGKVFIDTKNGNSLNNILSGSGNDGKNLDMKIWKTECTFSILILISIIFIFYNLDFFKNIPCDDSFSSILFRNFIHKDLFHLVSNIAGLVILYKIESSSGFNKFLFYFISILLLNTIIEYIIYHNSNINCSIGLSGIIFGFAVFELVNSSNCNVMAITALVAMLTLPSIKNSNVSIVGHLTGALSGLIIALFTKFFKL